MNKEAMGSNIRRIIEFLSLHNYNQEINVTMLRDMRDYDFESIVKFLLRLIDPNIRIENSIKEDFPRIMQMLGYPTQFKKSTMSSINTPFNLPTIIAAIQWLTRVVDFIQATGEEQRQKEKANEDHMYASMKQAYQFFMDNDDNSKDILIQEIEDGLNRDNQSLETELGRLEVQKQDLDDEVSDLVNVGKEIPQLQEQEKYLLRDREKFVHIIEGAQRQITSDTAKKLALESRESEMQESISCLRAKNEALRLKVSQQEFSPEQVEEIRRAAETWREKIADATKQKQEVSSRLDASVAAIDEKATAIDRMLERYHSSLLQLELLPASAPLAGGVDFRVSLEHVEDASSATTRDVQQYQRQLLGNTVLGRLETVLEEYVRAVGKAVLSFREEMVKFDDKRQKKEAELQRRQTAVAALKEQCERLQQQRDQLVCRCTDSQQTSSEDIERMRMRLVETKVATQALQRDAEALKTRCEAMRGEREKNLREMAAEARQTQEEIVSLLDAVSRYKETIDNEAQRLHSFAQECSRE